MVTARRKSRWRNAISREVDVAQNRLLHRQPDGRAALELSHEPPRARTATIMEGMLRKIADVFQEDPGPDSTLADLQLLQQRFAPKPGVVLSAPAFGAALPVASPQPGTVYVHARRPHEPMPTVGQLPRTGAGPLDAEFSKKLEVLVHAMRTAYSPYSLAGLEWLEARAKADAVVAAARAAEDAEIAKKRFEEDSALAAARKLQDDERGATAQREEAQWCASREAEEEALGQQWKARQQELNAALEERVAAVQSDAAMAEVARKEAEAMAQEAAAREAAARAESAAKEAESLVNARREAELAKLRLAAQPSIRRSPSWAPSTSRGGVRVRRGGGGGRRRQGECAVLRLDDRSWWHVYFLEAEVSPRNSAARNSRAQFLGAILR